MEGSLPRRRCCAHVSVASNSTTQRQQEWFFGVKAPVADGIASVRGDEAASTDIRDDDGDQELSSDSDTELDASALQTVAYPPLTPPPEVAEALSRARTR